MIGASIELTLWASSLREVMARTRPSFTQERVAASASLFPDGLLGPWRQQAIRGQWEADALRDYALGTLSDPDAMLVIDGTGRVEVRRMLRPAR